MEIFFLPINKVLSAEFSEVKFTNLFQHRAERDDQTADLQRPPKGFRESSWNSSKQIKKKKKDMGTKERQKQRSSHNSSRCVLFLARRQKVLDPSLPLSKFSEQVRFNPYLQLRFEEVKARKKLVLFPVHNIGLSSFITPTPPCTWGSNTHLNPLGWAVATFESSTKAGNTRTV